MPKNHHKASVKYYQNNKERLQKMIVKDVKISLKKRNTKSDTMFAKTIQISQKMANKN